MPTPLLAARGLALSYRRGAPPVFTGVDLTVRPREIVALVGESGCGKSSLLGLLAGLARPSAGAIQFRGTPVQTTPGEVAVVFQDPCLLPWLSVEGNAGFGLGFRRLGLPRAERRARVAAALTDVGLADHARRYPHQLSGGMAQRLALARALGRQPVLILLDEPFSALDAITREAMQALLTELVHRHASAALLVTHDIDEALRVSDRVLLMGGRPAGIVGEWDLLDALGAAPRERHLPRILDLRAEILDALTRHRSPAFPGAGLGASARDAATSFSFDPIALPETP